MDSDKIEEMFGKVAEAGDQTGAILLRVPQTGSGLLDGELERTPSPAQRDAVLSGIVARVREFSVFK